MKMFPILRYGRPRGCPDSIPWEMLAPHEEQAKKNHGGQTLQRLSERGGLSIQEAYYILKDQEWPRFNVNFVRGEDALEYVGQLVQEWSVAVS